MEATCIRRGSELVDHQTGRGGMFAQAYPATPGKPYVVAGMGLWEHTLHLLVVADDGLPAWAPAGLFRVREQSIPPWWDFATCDGLELPGRQMWTRCLAIWGYGQLVHDEDHRNGLAERNPEALAIFSAECARLRSA